MRIIDISRPVAPGIPVWPGDTPYDFDLVWRIAEGASVNVGRVEMSVHTGTHADAPLHFADGATDAASVELASYVGPCVVADVRQSADVRPSAGGIRPLDLPASIESDLREAPRLLLRTYAERPTAFDEDLAHATPELAEWLGARGVLLLGLDSDSMDAFDSEELPAHKALLRHGVAIIEGLDLSAAAPGRYDLVALPLRLVGADASPVRAVLLDRLADR